MKKDNDIKNKIIQDVIQVNIAYQENFPNGNLITRDYYREQGEYKDKDIIKHLDLLKL